MAGNIRDTVKKITKAADQGKFSRLIDLLATLLRLVGEYTPPAAPKPKKDKKGIMSTTSKVKPDKKLPDKKIIDDAKEALTDMLSRLRTGASPPKAMGLFGGKVNWAVIVPILVDLAKKILDGIGNGE